APGDGRGRGLDLRRSDADVGTPRRPRGPRGRALLTTPPPAASIRPLTVESGRRTLRAASAAALLLFSLGPVACAKARVAAPQARPAGLRSATVDEVLAAYDGYCKKLDTLSASGDLDVRDVRAGKAHSLGVRLVATRGGRLYLKGSVAVITALEVV